MANAYVQKVAAQSTTSVSSFTSSAITVTAGNALAVASCANAHLSVIPSLAVTDSQGDVFSTQVNHDDGSVNIAQWDLTLNVGGGSTTFTVTPSFSTFVSVSAQEYSGVGDSSVVEAVAGDGFFYAGAGLTPNPGVLSPVSAGDLYLSAWVHNGAGSETFTPAAGWTLRSNLTNTANMPLGSEEFIGSGSQTGSALLSGSDFAIRWECVAMALRAANVAAPDDGDSPNFLTLDFPMTNRGFGE